MSHRIVVIVACLCVSGCATGPEINEIGECTQLKRTGFKSEAWVRSSAIQHVNALLEFPAEVFQSVSLVVPPELQELGVVGMHVIRSEESFPQYGNCERTNKQLFACSLKGPEASGWSLSVVSDEWDNRKRILNGAQEYWGGLLACEEHATRHRIDVAPPDIRGL